MKQLKKRVFVLIAGLMALQATPAAFADSSVTYLPNQHGKSLTTPVAWGASGNVLFFGAGGTISSPYTTKADGAAVLGAGFGNPKEDIGLQVSLVSLDISEWKEYSASFQLFRDLGNASAIGVGVENVMITSGGDAGKSYYAVYSHGIQDDMFVNTDGVSKLHFSIGYGTGRFGNNSPMDIAAGKSRHGTYLFGNVAYDVADEFNVVADWNGLNLNAGLSKTFWFGKLPVAATVGAADLTRNSGDKARMVFAVGTGFKIN